MTAQTITLFNHAALTLAVENARAGQTYDHDGLVTLATSIREMHRQTGRALIEPLKAYPTDTGAAVWDGGRRLAALGLISDDGDDEGRAILAAVPVILTTQEEAGVASLATFVREEIHPVDQFLAWNALHVAGQSPEAIAAACGASPHDVEKLLRFQMLAPEILDAFKAGRFDFDVATAFTLTDDHEKQQQVLASFGEKAINAWQVRNALKAQSVDEGDRRARFVGREAYAEAGGRFITDLFTYDRIDEDWADEALLQRLYDAKLAQLVADLEAEGWGAVVQAGDRYGQGWRNGLEAIEPEGEDEAFTPEQMAAGMALIVFDYQGRVDIKRGFQKAKASRSGLSDAPVPLSKSDPARYGFGHGGHERLTKAATTATQAALLARPDAAYDATVAHLAWLALGRGSSDVHVSLLSAGWNRSGRHADLSEAIDAWNARLPTKPVEFWTAVADLTADEKAGLLAVAFAATLDATELKSNERRPHRWATLGFIATRAGADMSTALTVDHDFLKGGSREALLSIIANPAFKDSKKGVLIERAKQTVETGGWTPLLLADLVAAPTAPEKPAKGAPKAKAAGKAPAKPKAAPKAARKAPDAAEAPAGA